MKCEQCMVRQVVEKYGTICSTCAARNKAKHESLQPKQTDQKVKDYLERALEIYKLHVEVMGSNMIVEIAKMIQREEQ